MAAPAKKDDKGGKKDEKPPLRSLVERIEDYQARQKEVRRDEVTRQNRIAEAYLNQAKKHLYNEKTGEFDTSVLDTNPDLHYTLAKGILDDVVDSLHTKRGRGDVKKGSLYHQQLKQWLTGLTDADLRNVIGELGSNFTLDTHKKVISQRVDKILEKIAGDYTSDALGGPEYHAQNAKFLGADPKTISPEDSANAVLQYIGTVPGRRAYNSAKEAHKKEQEKNKRKAA